MSKLKTIARSLFETGARTREIHNTLEQVVCLRANGEPLGAEELENRIGEIWTDLHNNNEGKRIYILAAAREMLAAETARHAPQPSEHLSV